MRLLTAVLFLACGAVSAQPGPPPAPAPAVPAASAQAVVDAAQRLFDAMEARDSLALQAVLHPDAQIIGVGPDGRARVEQNLAAWIRAVATSHEPWRERIHAPRVEVDGPIATLWAPYTFHVGSEFSHCGTDAFQFVHDGEAWRLMVVSFTMQQEGCLDAEDARP